MSQIEINSELAIGPAFQAETRVSNRQQTRINQALMWALLGFLALSPLPLGSNRPVFWAASAVIVGLIAIGYVIALYRQDGKLRFELGAMRIQVTLFALYAGFLLVQLLPIGHLLGGLMAAGAELLQPLPDTISIAPGATTLMLLRALTYGVFFFLMLQVAVNDTRRNFALDFILTVITIYALIGIVSLRLGDTILGLEKWAYKGSATGTFVNRNSYATYLAFGAVIALTQLMNIVAERIEQRRAGEPRAGLTFGFALYGLALAVILAAIVASQSRMGVFVTLGGGFVVAILAIVRGGRGLSMTLLLVCAAVAGSAAALTLYGDGLLERLGSLEKSSGVRTDLYAQVLDLIALRPWTGFGGGSFELAFPLVHHLPVSPDVVWDKAHNTYLALWSELGIVFGSIPILLLGATVVRLIGARIAGHGSWRAQTMALGVITVGALHSLVDFSLEIQADTLLFLALTALGLATTLRPTKAQGS
jgi:O-antigen ligase